MRLLIRTEASAQIGLGHFMRCFAIAEAARGEGIEVTFLLNDIGEAVQTRLDAIGAAGRLMASAIGTAGDFDGVDFDAGDWLIIDSYAASSAYIAAARHLAHVAVIDDLNVLDRFDCDLIVNAAMAAKSENYAAKTTARLLLGPDYALIRQEFRIPHSAASAQPFVAIMFGGSDPAGLTGDVARLLCDALQSVNVRMIAGPANVRIAELRQMEADCRHVKLYVSPPGLADVLAGASLVITAAGGSVGEVAAMGLPALVLVVYDNQKAALDACPYPVVDARGGLPDELATIIRTLINDAERLKILGRDAHRIVDGLGARRVVEAMKNV